MRPPLLASQELILGGALSTCEIAQGPNLSVVEIVSCDQTLLGWVCPQETNVEMRSQ